MTEMVNNPERVYHWSYKKWTKPPLKEIIPFWILWIFGGLLASGIILSVLNFILRKQVNLKTKSLLIEIADRKGGLDALDAEIEQLDVTLRSIGDGVITTDRNGSIIMINKVVETLTGWSSDVLSGGDSDTPECISVGAAYAFLHGNSAGYR